MWWWQLCWATVMVVVVVVVVVEVAVAVVAVGVCRWSCVNINFEYLNY